MFLIAPSRTLVGLEDAKGGINILTGILTTVLAWALVRRHYGC
ncbi:MAG: hypothetical protein ACOCX4_08960 [Planctomycetota bacterium]